MWSSCVVLFSQIMYTTVMSIQYTRYLCTHVCRRGQATAPIHPALGGGTWTNFLCGIEHFRSSSESKSLRLDRGGLWRLCYPVAMSFFCLFVCIPGYDATCTCALCAGLFIRTVYQEFVRGVWFHRPLSRRLLLTVLALFGALSIVLLFALGYTTGLLVTNRGLETSRLVVSQEGSSLLDSLADGDANATLGDTGIINNFIYDAEISNPDVVQYLQWTVHSYPRKMCAVWFLFFLAAFMLANVPEAPPSLLVLEAAQTSTTCIAAMNLCCVSIVLSRQPFVLLKSSTSASVAYMLLSPALTWLIIKKIIQYQRQRVLYVPLCVIVLVTFAKHCIQHQGLASERFFSDLSIVCGVIITGYALASALFWRLEGAAVRDGWGQTRSTHVELRDSREGLDEDDEDDDSDPAKFSITEQVQDVLKEAKRDLQMAERIVQASMAEEDGVDGVDVDVDAVDVELEGRERGRDREKRAGKKREGSVGSREDG